jgi:coenzyme Q-binding protein COQ10
MIMMMMMMMMMVVGMMMGSISPVVSGRLDARVMVSSFTMEQVFDVVADVAAYEHFVPWVVSSAVQQRLPSGGCVAQLRVGFGPFTECYTSHVSVERPNWVRALAADSSVFKHLVTTWRFHPGPTVRTTVVDFSISFEFASALHATLATAMMSEVTSTMVRAFVDRCVAKYGAPAAVVQ